MKRERTAALSAVGLMLIAGCSGGRSVSSTPSLPVSGTGQGASASAPHNATLQIPITAQQPGPQSATHRTSGMRYASGVRYASNARRHPSWFDAIATSSVTLKVVPTNGGPTYLTSFALSTCSETYGSSAAGFYDYYLCPVNVPSGSNTFYMSMYDAYGALLSTNLYNNPQPQIVNANGSAASNTIYIYEQGVVANIQQQSPVTCFSAGYPQVVPFLFNDADGTPIFGPLANPITPTFTAYNGNGLAALAPYATYFGGAYPYASFSVNNQTLYDTSFYFPYLWVSGQEGAVNVSATVQNIPVYNNGYATYTPYNTTGYFATGTYIAWGIGSGNYDLYAMAIQTLTNQVVPCGDVNGAYQQWTYVGGIVDPSNGNPYLVLSDGTSKLSVYDAFVTANAQRSFPYFQTGNAYGNPGLRFILEEPLAFYGSVFGNNLIDFFTSSVVPGRIDVLSMSSNPGHIDLIDCCTTHNVYGSPQSDFGTHSFTTGVSLTGATRLAGSSVSGYLYYNDPSTPFLYAAYVPTNSGNASSINFASSTQINGQIYAVAGSGATGTYIFARGATTGASFYLCEFDSNPAFFSLSSSNCHYTTSYNANPSSLTFDPGSGNLMFSGGYNAATFTSSVYALPANQAPMTFASNPFGSAPFYTLQSETFRFTPTTAAPGIVGLYGGPQVNGPCAGTGEVTWLSYSSGAFHYIASVCWANHYITLTYP